MSLNRGTFFMGHAGARGETWIQNLLSRFLTPVRIGNRNRCSYLLFIFHIITPGVVGSVGWSHCLSKLRSNAFLVNTINCCVYRVTEWELCGVEVFILEPPVMNWKSFLWSLYLYGRVPNHLAKTGPFCENRNKREKRKQFTNILAMWIVTSTECTLM